MRKLSIYSTLSLIIILLTTHNVYASFTVARNIIKQKWTDDNLSNLKGVSGVEYFVVGSGASAHTVYRLSKKLIVEGTLSFDSDKESIVFIHNCPSQWGYSVHELEVRGSLTIGKSKVDYGHTSYSKGVGLKFPRTDRNSWEQAKGNLIVKSGATFEMLGGVLFAGSAIHFESNSTVRVTNALLKGKRSVGGGIYIRSWSTDCKFVNTTLENVQYSSFRRPSVWRGNLLIDCSFSAVGPSNSGTLKEFFIEGLDVENSSVQFRNEGSAVVTLFNVANGSSITHSMNHGQPHFVSSGGSKLFKDFSIKVENEDYDPINNANIYIRDVNNGKRTILTSSGSPAVVENYTNDIEYFFSSNSLGETGTQRILTTIFYFSGIQDVDFRGKSVNDDFDIHLWHYQYKYKLVSNEFMRGNGIKDIHVRMYKDHDINLPKATVTSMSGISINHAAKTISITQNQTLSDLYHFVKANKVANLNNIKSPSINAIALYREGSETLISEYNINVANGVVVSESDNFKKLKCLRSINLNSNGYIDLPHTDINNTGYIKLFGLASADKVTVLFNDGSVNFSTNGNVGYMYDVADSQHRVFVEMATNDIVAVNHGCLAGMDNFLNCSLVTDRSSAYTSAIREKLFKSANNLRKDTEENNELMLEVKALIKVISKKIRHVSK